MNISRKAFFNFCFSNREHSSGGTRKAYNMMIDYGLGTRTEKLPLLLQDLISSSERDISNFDPNNDEGLTLDFLQSELGTYKKIAEFAGIRITTKE